LYLIEFRFFCLYYSSAYTILILCLFNRLHPPYYIPCVFRFPAIFVTLFSVPFNYTLPRYFIRYVVIRRLYVVIRHLALSIALLHRIISRFEQCLLPEFLFAPAASGRGAVSFRHVMPVGHGNGLRLPPRGLPPRSLPPRSLHP
jgi:hypothetical protein